MDDPTQDAGTEEHQDASKILFSLGFRKMDDPTPEQDDAAAPVVSTEEAPVPAATDDEGKLEIAAKQEEAATTTSLHTQPPQASPSMKGMSPARIPKKVQPTTTDSLAPPPLTTNSFDSGVGPFILPDGVQLPPSVTPQMIDGRLRRTFLDLTPSQMREVLQEYDDAVREKGASIRNHAAYLFGVVKRYKSLHDRSLMGDNATPQGNNISAPVLVSLRICLFVGIILSLTLLELI